MHQIAPRFTFLIILLSVFYGQLFACVYTVNIATNPNTAICPGTSVSLTASGSSGAFTYTYNWSNGSTTAAINVAPVTTTNYTVTVTNNLGCTVTATATVTVNPNPTAAITPSTVSICSGQSTTLTAGGGGTYKWSTNATTASIIVSPTASTTYTVTVTNASNCTATVSRMVTVNSLPNAGLRNSGSVLETLFAGDTTFYMCGTNSATFTFRNVSTPNSGLTYQVIWGDTGAVLNINSSWTTINHIYGVGYYTLQVIATNISGCTDTARYKIFYGNTPNGGISQPGNAVRCLPVTLAFPMSNWQGDPKGTIYTISLLSE